ncbi:MAG TPA: hypothetical protein GX506_09980 [Firmicutes bacterium]|nr:hypothetical protein [Bacillota bacterium]
MDKTAGTAGGGAVPCDLDHLQGLIYDEQEYSPDKGLSREEILSLLEAFRRTYSSGNLQPWEVIVVQDPEKKRQIVGCTLDAFFRDSDEMRQTWIESAPVVLVILANLRRALSRFGEAGRDVAIQDVAAAVQNLRLSACQNGIASAWIREISAERITRLFSLGKHLLPVGLVTLGFPKNPEKAAMEFEGRPRLAINRFCRWA